MRDARKVEGKSGELIQQLKLSLRAAGLTYGDLAETLGVSLATVKRYMMGRGLTLNVLDRLCACVDLTVVELAQLAARPEELKNAMEEWQEIELAKDRYLSMTLYLLARGMEPDRIAEQLCLSPDQMDRLLIRLDRLKLIILHPRNRVRVLVRHDHEVHSKALRQDRVDTWNAAVARADITDPKILWRMGFTRMTPAAYTHALKRFSVLLEELSDMDALLSGADAGQAEWCYIGLLMNPIDLDILLNPPERQGMGRS